MPGKVQIDPTKPLAVCRLEWKTEGEKNLSIQCKHDRERLPAAKEQGLQCHLESKFEKKDGKVTLDFLLFCEPKEGFFRKTMKFRVLDDPQLKKFFKEYRLKESLDRFRNSK